MQDTKESAAISGAAGAVGFEWWRGVAGAITSAKYDALLCESALDKAIECDEYERLVETAFAVKERLRAMHDALEAIYDMVDEPKKLYDCGDE